jgi:pyruvate dehydrogenase E2 component (dihydrolipoamide acetyltransferase)
MKAVGDEVALGDELVEIETDKANMVFEADVAGTLIEISAQEGDTLPIGEVIARVGAADEAGADGDAADGGGDGASPPPGSPRSAAESPPGDSAAPAPAQAEPSTAEAAEAASTPSPTQPASDAGNGRVKASPLARRIAGEKGIELGSIEGSGPGGRIVKADLERVLASSSASTQTLAPQPQETVSAPSPAQAGSSLSEGAGTPSAPRVTAAPAAPAAPERPETAKGAVRTVELSKLQRTVARRMAESKATAPHFYLSAEIEMSRAFEARARLKAAAAEGEVVPSLNDLVIKACALALREYPRANGAYRDGRWELYERVNVGVAVAAEAALVVPTIFDADKKGLRRIATEARALAQRVRDKTITPPELSGATFTVSNLGMYGVSNFGAVINSPQAAILAVGEIAERAVVGDAGLAAARLMGVTLACDHRILYGAEAAEFLARVRALLEEPLGLAL